MNKLILDPSHYKNESIPFWEKWPIVLIYGAGNIGKDVFRALKGRGISIRGFLDKKAHDSSAWDGVPIFQPDDKRLSIADRQRASVIIAIHNRDVEMPPIFEQLHALGYGRSVSLIELYDWIGKELGDRFWLTSRAHYQPQESFIRAAFNLWSDETSRMLYAALFAFRLSGDFNQLPSPDTEHQYFPLDLPPWKMPLRFVDCGAFDGDTLAYLLKTNIPVEAIAAFEPDEANFNRLAHFIKSHQTLRDVMLWPCGVSAATKQLPFISGNGESSMLVSGSNACIQCVALDEVIPNFYPTLIKMDIEGAEYDALMGAQSLIERYKPGLAVSLYHKPEHLWQIPLLLKQLCGEKYTFHLRSHGFSDFDLVLYAIPE